MLEVLDPTWGDATAAFTRAERLPTIEGTTIGIVSNGKKNTAEFFAALASELRSNHGVADVVLVTKRNYSAPAEVEIMDRATEWNALISGIGD